MQSKQEQEPKGTVQRSINRFLSVKSKSNVMILVDENEPLLSPMSDSEWSPTPATTISQEPMSPHTQSYDFKSNRRRSDGSVFPSPSQFGEDIIERESYRQAVVHVLNAFQHSNQCQPMDGAGPHIAHMINIHLQVVFSYVVFILVLASFFEKPVWCIRMDASGSNKCTNSTAQDAMYPMTGLPWMSHTVNFVVEVSLLSVLVIEILLQFTAYGLQKVLRDNLFLLNLILVLLYCVELAYAYTTPLTWIRFAPYIRILMFVNKSQDVRQQVRLFIRILPRFLAIAFIVFLYITVFAFIGVLLLKEFRWNYGTYHNYFNTMGHAYWSLMVLLTTCNYPDVAIQAYTFDRTSFLFFLTFSVGGIFFLINFATAIVYNTYTEQDEVERTMTRTQEEKHLQEAFDLIDEDQKGYISFEEFMVMVDEMRKYRRLSSVVKGEITGLIFAVLDSDGSQMLTFEKFRMLVNVLHMRFEKLEEETYFERNFPVLFKSKTFQVFKEIVLSAWFDYGMILILLVMGVFTVWESWADITHDREPSSKRTDRKPDSFWNVIELTFTVIFVVEATFKILAVGWKVYWKRDSFEFFVAVLSVVVTIIIYLPTNSLNDTIFIRYTLFLRLLQTLQILSAISAPGILRLMRLLTTIRYFQLFYLTIVRMIPPVVKVTKMLFCIMFFYSCLGVSIYGGLVNRDPDRVQYKRLLNTDYARAGYWAMNMNDMAGGMVIFFEMLIVNNWHLFVQGFVAVTSFWTYYFFISFFALGVIMGLNIVVAFVIDTFQREYDAQQKELDLGQGAAFVDQGEAIFEASVITGTRTGLQGLYRAQVVGGLDSQTKQEMIKKLFERKLCITTEEEGSSKVFSPSDSHSS